MRRSMLFVPGNTPKMMTSCGFFGADAVIFDLEDAVSPTEKDAARDLVRYAIGNLHLCGSEVIVRVNSIETPMFLADLAAVVPQKPDLIMLPKTCTAEDIQMLAQTLDRLEAENDGRMRRGRYLTRADRNGARRRKCVFDRVCQPAGPGAVPRCRGSERGSALQTDKRGDGDPVRADTAGHGRAGSRDRCLRHAFYGC